MSDRRHLFERGDYVRFYLVDRLTKEGKPSRDGMIMADEGLLTIEVRDLHSQYTYLVPAGHVWTPEGEPAADPEVSVSWSDDGLHIVCIREECMVVDMQYLVGQRRLWWTQEVPGNHVLPDRLQWYIDEHLKTHRNS